MPLAEPTVTPPVVVAEPTVTPHVELHVLVVAGAFGNLGDEESGRRRRANWEARVLAAAGVAGIARDARVAVGGVGVVAAVRDLDGPLGDVEGSARRGPCGAGREGVLVLPGRAGAVDVDVAVDV